MTEDTQVTGSSNEPPPGEPASHRKPGGPAAWLDRHKGTVVAAAIAAVALTGLGLLLGGSGHPARQAAQASPAITPSFTVTPLPTIPTPGPVATTVTAPAPVQAIAPAAYTQPAITTVTAPAPVKAATPAPVAVASVAPVAAPTVPAPATVTVTPVAPVTVTVTPVPVPTVTVTVTFTPTPTATPPVPVVPSPK